MPDDIAFPVPGGTQIAADDISGKKYQRVKLTHGADGTAVDASGSDPLPVTVVGGGGGGGGTTPVLQAIGTYGTPLGDSDFFGATGLPATSGNHLVLVGYQITATYDGSGPTGELWEVRIGGVNAATTSFTAAAALGVFTAEGDRATFAGTPDGPVAIIDPNLKIGFQVFQQFGTQANIHLTGHLTYYETTP